MTASDRRACDLPLPDPFSFSQCLVFLGRSDKECLHAVRDGALYKPVRLNGQSLLLKIAPHRDSLRIQPLNRPWDDALRAAAAAYVREWLDLDTDLVPFYHMAANDPLLAPPVDQYRGLRLVKIPDLFEALAWAVIGQQINLPYAYTLKKRLVEAYGENFPAEGGLWWLFPAPAVIARAPAADLTSLGLTRRKAEYLQGVAAACADGHIDKERLLGLGDLAALRRELTALRGVGDWTADYCIMKSLHHPAALPAADAGLHQALRRRLGLARKPTIEEIHAIAACWKGWEAYAVFYLWRSLYD